MRPMMDLALPILCALLTVGCLGYVAYPLRLARRARQTTGRRDRLLLQLTEQKQALYGAIRELQFDAEVGKLPQEDLQQQRQVLEDQALEVLTQLEQLESGDDEAALRAQIERDLAGRDSGETPEEADGRCPGCQAAVSTRYRFCPECGAALSPPSTP